MESPWSNIHRMLKRREWDALRSWIKSNPDKRFRMGHRREDGLIFLHYNIGARGGEVWRTEDRFIKHKHQIRAHSIKYRGHEDFRQKHNAYCRMKTATDARTREVKKQWSALYQKENRARERAKTIRYQARKERATICGHSLRKELQIYKRAEQLSVASGVAHEVDHIIPLSVGGWHHHDNLQAIPVTINRQKHSNPFWEAPTGYKDWRSVPSWLWPDHLVCAYLERLYIAA